MSNRRPIFTILHVSVLCQAPRVHTPAVNKYVGALLPRIGQGPYCTGIGSSFGPESHIVPNKQVVSTLDQVVSTPCSKHKTKSCKTGGVDTRDSFQKTFWQMWDSVSTVAQVVSTLETFPEHHLGSFGIVCRHCLKLCQH
ncbi:hypothetical protein Taro_000217 [Colocasia esculenta]|uniref:Uncharacterized protein n=1 Tax=Colocasia esculenta TaxID=4460 RepID=A0A843T6E8_COLES|nr:hypothetical protein [Colocasia esculenta]